MPLPKPHKDEPQEKFISRCMGDKEANKTFPKQPQRAGVCFTIWKESKKKKAKGSDSSIDGIDIFVVE